MVAQFSAEPAMRVVDSIETPCIRVCALRPGASICVGCGRSLHEIACWTTLTGQQRTQIMAQLPRRLETLTGPNVPATMA